MLMHAVSPQPWLSDPEDAPFLDPVLRKRAVKVKHVKRREKKSDKKVRGHWGVLGATGNHREHQGGCWGALGRRWEPLGTTGSIREGTGSHWEALGVTERAPGGYWEALGGPGGYWEGSWALFGGPGGY